MDNHKMKKQAVAATVFILLLLLSAALIAVLAVAEKRRNVRQAEYVMISEIGKLQYAIDSRLLSTEILEMVVVNNQGTVKGFDDIAGRLYENDPAIRSLQLAPDGVVSYVYPLKGNEKAFADLFSDPERKVEAEYARDTGRMTLAGPYELLQGGMGLVARNPIYIENEQNEEVFWGFSVAVLNVPEIFNKVELENLSQQGYDYQIYRIKPDGGGSQIIAGNADHDIENAVEGEITVPNGTWFFRIWPGTGWVSVKNIILESVVALTIALLLSLLVYGILTISQQKKIMTELANADSLTGLYNVRNFMMTMKHLYDRQEPFGVIYLDLNKFKAVNDEFGHDIGDKLLAEVASRIKGGIRRDDLAYRIGGDEFAIIIQSQHPREFYDGLIRRIVGNVAKPYTLPDIELHPSISCGYARYPEDQTGLEELIQEADKNMYAMKRKSRD